MARPSSQTELPQAFLSTSHRFQLPPPCNATNPRPTSRIDSYFSPLSMLTKSPSPLTMSTSHALLSHSFHFPSALSRDATASTIQSPSQSQSSAAANSLVFQNRTLPAHQETIFLTEEQKNLQKLIALEREEQRIKEREQERKNQLAEEKRRKQEELEKEELARKAQREKEREEERKAFEALDRLMEERRNKSKTAKRQSDEKTDEPTRKKGRRGRPRTIFTEQRNTVKTEERTNENQGKDDVGSNNANSDEKLGERNMSNANDQMGKSMNKQESMSNEKTGNGSQKDNSLPGNEEEEDDEATEDEETYRAKQLQQRMQKDEEEGSTNGYVIHLRTYPELVLKRGMPAPIEIKTLMIRYSSIHLRNRLVESLPLEPPVLISTLSDTQKATRRKRGGDNSQRNHLELHPSLQSSALNAYPSTVQPLIQAQRSLSAALSGTPSDKKGTSATTQLSTTSVSFTNSVSSWSHLCSDVKVAAEKLAQYRRSLLSSSQKVNKSIMRYFQTQEKALEAFHKQQCAKIARMIRDFWNEVREYVELKQQMVKNQQVTEIKAQSFDDFVGKMESWSSSIAARIEGDSSEGKSDSKDQSAQQKNSEEAKNVSQSIKDAPKPEDKSGIKTRRHRGSVKIDSELIRTTRSRAKKEQTVKEVKPSEIIQPSFVPSSLDEIEKDDEIDFDGSGATEAEDDVDEIATDEEFDADADNSELSELKKAADIPIEELIQNLYGKEPITIDDDDDEEEEKPSLNEKGKGRTTETKDSHGEGQEKRSISPFSPFSSDFSPEMAGSQGEGSILEVASANAVNDASLPDVLEVNATESGADPVKQELFDQLQKEKEELEQKKAKDIQDKIQTRGRTKSWKKEEEKVKVKSEMILRSVNNKTYTENVSQKEEIENVHSKRYRSNSPFSQSDDSADSISSDDDDDPFSHFKQLYLKMSNQPASSPSENTPVKSNKTINNASPQHSHSSTNSSASSSTSGAAGSTSTDHHNLIETVREEANAAAPTGFTLASSVVRTKVPHLIHGPGPLREYQIIGLDWLATMYEKNLNVILADEMGLGKTVMAVSLLAHLACEKGIWGPHLIIVPSSVLVNWEIEIKRWCPAFKILTYYGSTQERKAKREGWSRPNAFHICITTYKLVTQDYRIFRMKSWCYMILDEAHNIKNFKTQRWQKLLHFNTKHRLLLTGTPLQNSVMELWSLMHFLMPDVFSSHAEFNEWFNIPLTALQDGGSSGGGMLDDGGGIGSGAQDDAQRSSASNDLNPEIVQRLHNVLRPFILRRLKQDVEKQLPAKYEHIIVCPLSKRQRLLYEEFMAASDTKRILASGNYMGMCNVLMQLRKVCNHPNLFEAPPVASPVALPAVRITPCVTSSVEWMMGTIETRNAIEIKKKERLEALKEAEEEKLYNEAMMKASKKRDQDEDEDADANEEAAMDEAETAPKNVDKIRSAKSPDLMIVERPLSSTKRASTDTSSSSRSTKNDSSPAPSSSYPSCIFNVFADDPVLSLQTILPTLHLGFPFASGEAMSRMLSEAADSLTTSQKQLISETFIAPSDSTSSSPSSATSPFSVTLSEYSRTPTNISSPSLTSTTPSPSSASSSDSSSFSSSFLESIPKFLSFISTQLISSSSSLFELISFVSPGFAAQFSSALRFASFSLSTLYRSLNAFSDDPQLSFGKRLLSRMGISASGSLFSLLITALVHSLQTSSLQLPSAAVSFPVLFSLLSITSRDVGSQNAFSPVSSPFCLSGASNLPNSRAIANRITTLSSGANKELEEQIYAYHTKIDQLKSKISNLRKFTQKPEIFHSGVFRLSSSSFPQAQSSEQTNPLINSTQTMAEQSVAYEISKLESRAANLESVLRLNKVRCSRETLMPIMGDCCVMLMRGGLPLRSDSERYANGLSDERRLNATNKQEATIQMSNVLTDISDEELTLKSSEANNLPSSTTTKNAVNVRSMAIMQKRAAFNQILLNSRFSEKTSHKMQLAIRGIPLQAQENGQGNKEDPLSCKFFEISGDNQANSECDADSDDADELDSLLSGGFTVSQTGSQNGYLWRSNSLNLSGSDMSTTSLLKARRTVSAASNTAHKRGRKRGRRPANRGFETRQVSSPVNNMQPASINGKMASSFPLPYASNMTFPTHLPTSSEEQSDPRKSIGTIFTSHPNLQSISPFAYPPQIQSSFQQTSSLSPQTLRSPSSAMPFYLSAASDKSSTPNVARSQVASTSPSALQSSTSISQSPNAQQMIPQPLKEDSSQNQFTDSPFSSNISPSSTPPLPISRVTTKGKTKFSIRLTPQPPSPSLQTTPPNSMQQGPHTPSTVDSLFADSPSNSSASPLSASPTEQRETANLLETQHDLVDIKPLSNSFMQNNPLASPQRKMQPDASLLSIASIAKFSKTISGKWENEDTPALSGEMEQDINQISVPRLETCCGCLLCHDGKTIHPQYAHYHARVCSRMRYPHKFCEEISSNVEENCNPSFDYSDVLLHLVALPFHLHQAYSSTILSQCIVCQPHSITITPVIPNISHISPFKSSINQSPSAEQSPPYSALSALQKEVFSINCLNSLLFSSDPISLHPITSTMHASSGGGWTAETDGISRVSGGVGRIWKPKQNYSKDPYRSYSNSKMNSSIDSFLGNCTENCNCDGAFSILNEVVSSSAKRRTQNPHIIKPVTVVMKADETNIPSSNTASISSSFTHSSFSPRNSVKAEYVHTSASNSPFHSQVSMSSKIDDSCIIKPLHLKLPSIHALSQTHLTNCHTTDSEMRSESLIPIFRITEAQMSVSFPPPHLVQHDCGKLQCLAALLKNLQKGGHRCLIFTQMSKMLDILEVFASSMGYAYLRLDGATPIDKRQRLMELFNTTPRIFLFLLSTRSGGIGVNLIGADTVIFYDSDWNPAMDAQAEDRAHRIGQTREVHVYRLISQSTVEENILRRAKWKRKIESAVTREGNFTYSGLLKASDVRHFLGMDESNRQSNTSSRRSAGGSDISQSQLPSEELQSLKAAGVNVMSFEEFEDFSNAQSDSSSVQGGFSSDGDMRAMMPISSPSPASSSQAIDVERAMALAEDDDDRSAMTLAQQELMRDQSAFNDDFRGTEIGLIMHQHSHDDQLAATGEQPSALSTPDLSPSPTFSALSSPCPSFSVTPQLSPTLSSSPTFAVEGLTTDETMSDAGSQNELSIEAMQQQGDEESGILDAMEDQFTPLQKFAIRSLLRDVESKFEYELSRETEGLLANQTAHASRIEQLMESREPSRFERGRGVRRGRGRGNLLIEQTIKQLLPAIGALILNCELFHVNFPCLSSGAV
eukprot:MONOS_8198.1-p1 / transcript=MONOS_8198.1 / gene=MONOS_8198 / organism=Monocercomonoides_exilis_PA203 / gene_product=Snf2-related CBP activator protein / transcript_product=Snf2-related CBP activator protein / location=Mono_scaffold00302:46549-56647(-) / protein_length=3278 / sequence_SO=supercontig / SO=protein_coding / is_pseudo=false